MSWIFYSNPKEENSRDTKKMMEPCVVQDSITMAQNVSSRAWLSPLTHPELRWLSESSDGIGEEVKYSQSQIRL